MCIIAIKPQGVALPDADTITNMWVNNPDGAGYMYSDNGDVHIEKGFMTLKSFRKSLKALGETIDITNTPMILHFRIGTHGGNTPENTHPFPVSESVSVLQKLKVKVPLGVVHNGIIDITPRKGISDTMEYILTQLSLIHKLIPNFYINPLGKQLVKNGIRSKMAFLDGSGIIELIGDFVKEDGMIYSNRSYERYINYAKWDDSVYGTMYGTGYSTKTDSWVKYYSPKKKGEKTKSKFDDKEYPPVYADEITPHVKSYMSDDYSDVFEDERDEPDSNLLPYVIMPLQWLSSEDSYVVDDTGEPQEAENYLMDKDWNVYRYDYHLDMAVKTNCNAYNTSGTFKSYDEDDVVMMEVKI